MDLIEQIKRYVYLNQFDDRTMESILREFKRRGLSNHFDGGITKEFADKVFSWLVDNIERLDLNIGLKKEANYERLIKTTFTTGVVFIYKAGFVIQLTTGDYLLEFVKYSNSPFSSVTLSSIVEIDEYFDITKSDDEILMGLNDEQLNYASFFDEAMKNFIDNLNKLSSGSYLLSDLGLFNFRANDIYSQR